MDEDFRESPIVERNTTTSFLKKHPFISDLPTEILIMIFRHAFPPPETFPDRLTPSPLLLRRVCKEWEFIVEQTPALWLSLRPPSRAPRLPEDIRSAAIDWYKRVTTHISRNVTAFNHIVIELPKEREEIHNDLLQYLLLDLAPRSAAMKLYIPSQLLCEIDRGALLGPSSPLLETPTRRRHSDGITMEHLKTVDWEMLLHPFGKQFHLDLGLPWTSLRRLPWTQLTRVNLALSMTLEDCVFIFDNASAIEKLSLKLVSGEPLPHLALKAEKKALSHLCSFAMEAEVSLTSLFQRFEMPQLCDLDLNLGGVDPVTDLPQLNVPWGQLTHFALDCLLPTEVMENVIRQLGAIVILELRLRGVLDGPTWAASPTVLGSLKSFTLLHASDDRGDALMSQFVPIIPTSIESIYAPLIPAPFVQMKSNQFNSLKTVNLTQPILPSDFLSFLDLAVSLKRGSFTVRDNLDRTPEFYSPPSVLTAYPLPHSLPLVSFEMTKSRVNDLDLHLDFQYSLAQPLLDALILPDLTSLKLKASKKSSDCNSLYALLERSHCHLSSLSLNCSSIPDGGALRLLRLMSPTLEDLKIETGPFTGLGSEFCQGLMHEDDGLLMECLCPRLERLHLWPCMDAFSFYKMVESRSNSFAVCSCGVRRLQYVGAGLPDNDFNCSEFARQLKLVGISSELKSLYSW
jgi:hypothetical protein